MRIRTVKPDFWTHPVMTRQKDFTKLLAIALLNYADDEGYFYADEDLMRGALFPREDSKKIRRSIDELSKIGYIDTSEHETHGLIGRVVSFNDHQRIDRAKPSIIKEFYKDTNNRRTIDEQSTLEGKGKEQGKEQGKSKATLSELTLYCKELELPESDAEALFAKWEGNGWTNNGKKMKSIKHTIVSWKTQGYLPSQKNAKSKPNRTFEFTPDPSAYTAGKTVYTAEELEDVPR